MEYQNYEDKHNNNLWAWWKDGGMESLRRIQYGLGMAGTNNLHIVIGY